MSTEETAAPRRHTLTDAYNDLKAVVEQLTTKTAEPYVSVEFTRNAKGETQISTKVSAPGGFDQAALEVLSQAVYFEAVQTYNNACATYPTGSGFVRNDGDAGK